jgi:hypothetical protein
MILYWALQVQLFLESVKIRQVIHRCRNGGPCDFLVVVVHLSIAERYARYSQCILCDVDLGKHKRAELFFPRNGRMLSNMGMSSCKNIKA